MSIKINFIPRQECLSEVGSSNKVNLVALTEGSVNATYSSQPDGVLDMVGGGIKEGFHNFYDGFSKVSDEIVGAEIEFFVKPFVSFVKDCFFGLIDLLNAHSVEIITLGMVFGALGMMVGPIVGSRPGKWFGRVIFVGMIGAIWRVII